MSPWSGDEPRGAEMHWEPLSAEEHDVVELKKQLAEIRARKTREFNKQQAVLERDRLRKEVEREGEEPCR